MSTLYVARAGKKSDDALSQLIIITGLWLACKIVERVVRVWSLQNFTQAAVLVVFENEERMFGKMSIKKDEETFCFV